MTDIRQNFSLIMGDDTEISYGITPPPPDPVDLTQADMSWIAYPQVRGAPDKTQAVITKTRAGGGIEITDPANYQFTVLLASADSTDLAGNYYYEIVIIDTLNANKRSTPTIGTMTVIDTSESLNVVAFKSMFPQFLDVDDDIIQTALDEAALFVDDTIWAATDVVAATFYLAGHFVATAQAGAGAGGQMVTSERIGQISVTYAAGTASGGAASTTYPSLSTSSYGLMFLAMMRRNSPGIAVV